MKKVILGIIAATCLAFFCGCSKEYEGLFQVKIENSSDKNVAFSITTESGKARCIHIAKDGGTGCELTQTKECRRSLMILGGDQPSNDTWVMRVYEYGFYVLDDTTSVRVNWGPNGTLSYSESSYGNFPDNGCYTPIISSISGYSEHDGSFVSWDINYDGEIKYHNDCQISSDANIQPTKDYTMLIEFADYYSKKAKELE